jgi:peptidoglycan/xylan/chitin deacetylase (PgdA/CDA1 family)
MNAVEGELSQLKKLVTELSDKISDSLSDNTAVSDSLPDNVSDIAETETSSEDRLGFAYATRTNNTLDNQESSLLSDNQSEIVPDRIDPISTKPIAENGNETISWRSFDRMIGEILPKDIRRNKEEAEKALRLAAERGFNGWRYDAKCKKFIKP